MNYSIPKPPIQKEEDRKKYHEYLRSPKWKRLTVAVFEREGGICQGCAEEPIENTHHMTYANLYDELLFQLVGVCETCHRKVHWIKESIREVPNDIEY
jgi:5-methylcytosine-specific restriction endonuclease McrA